MANVSGEGYHPSKVGSSLAPAGGERSETVEEGDDIGEREWPQKASEGKEHSELEEGEVGGNGANALLG